MKKRTLYCFLLLIVFVTFLIGCSNSVISRVSDDSGDGFVNFQWRQGSKFVDTSFSFFDKDLMVFLMKDGSIYYIPKDNSTSQGIYKFEVNFASDPSKANLFIVFITMHRESEELVTWKIKMKGETETFIVEHKGKSYNVVKSFKYEGRKVEKSFCYGKLTLLKMDFNINHNDFTLVSE